MRPIPSGSPPDDRPRLRPVLRTENEMNIFKKKTPVHVPRLMTPIRPPTIYELAKGITEARQKLN